MAKNETKSNEKKAAAPGTKPQAPKHRRGSSNKRPNKAAIVESVTRDELLAELESTPLRKSAPRHQRGSKMSDADLHRAGGLVAMLEPETAKKGSKDSSKSSVPSPAKQPSAPAQAAPSKPAAKSAPKKEAAAPAKAAPQSNATPEKPAPFEHAQTLPGTARKGRRGRPTGKIRVIPLGGLSEIGKNMTAIEYEDDLIVVDCGMGFPEEDMPGIDLVIPDITYLENNKDRIRGIFLTHGHEDHIGAIPYVLRSINPPIYGTRLTLGIVRNKLEEHTLAWTPKLYEVNAGDVIPAGEMSVEFIHVNHSIADACALAIRTPLGTIVHSGDFKLDISPIEGEMMDIGRLGELGREGILLLMCESTNAERPGSTPSERKVGESLEVIFSRYTDKRLVIATFSSNVHRVQQIIDVSARHGRKVAITGRSMINIVGAATELGYMTVPAGVLIDLSEIKRYRPEELTIVTTGSQGEPMSALYRMAYSDHAQITLGQNDLVILSAHPIPGNEKTVGRVINELTRNNIQCLHDASLSVHVSGHACQEELKLMQALTKPKYFMPIHGEYKHLAAHRELALYMGMESKNIFLSDIGKVLEITPKGAGFTQEIVPSGRVLVDGYGVGDVGNIVLRDRIHLAQDGLIVVVATLDEQSRDLLSGPDIVSRGFVYVRESETLMEEARRIAADAIDRQLRSGHDFDRTALKKQIKDDLTKFLYAKTKRKPMILPVIMNV